jgi:hypothetical protein
MRKLLLSLVCLAGMAGLVMATEAVVVSYKDKALTVTVDGKDSTYTVTDKTKVFFGKTEVTDAEKMEKALSSLKAGRKLDITTDGR